MSKGQIKYKLTPETIKKLEEAFAIDATVEEACFYADISTVTYYGWIKEFPKMKERFNALRQKPILKARQTIVNKLGDNYNNAIDYLKRKRRAEFGDVEQKIVTGKIEHTQNTENYKEIQDLKAKYEEDLAKTLRDKKVVDEQ